MSQIDAKPAAGPHGMAAWEIESKQLRLTVLPEAGGKIWQIVYKPTGAALLWNRTGIEPARHPLFTCYDDVWAGGWDELFPTDEPAQWGGLDLPDHGELWNSAWTAEPVSGGLRLSLEAALTRFRVEKTIVLDAGAAVVRVRYRLTNGGAAALPFMFKLHPAFAVTGRYRLDFPPMDVELEPEFLGTLEGAPAQFAWPYAPMPAGAMDLRQVPGPESGAVHFFYGTGLREGWCALTNQETGLAAALRFDPELFRSCWLFATHGGWNRLNVAVLEPSTGWPFRLEELIRRGRAQWLKPGERLETEVLFAAQPGLKSVGGVTAEGRILAGE